MEFNFFYKFSRIVTVYLKLLCKIRKMVIFSHFDGFSVLLAFKSN